MISSIFQINLPSSHLLLSAENPLSSVRGFSVVNYYKCYWCCCGRQSYPDQQSLPRAHSSPRYVKDWPELPPRLSSVHYRISTMNLFIVPEMTAAQAVWVQSVFQPLSLCPLLTFTEALFSFVFICFSQRREIQTRFQMFSL